MKLSHVLLVPGLLVITLVVSHTQDREDCVYHFDDSRPMFAYLNYLLSNGFLAGIDDLVHNNSSISSIEYCCYVDWDYSQEGHTFSELIHHGLNDTAYNQ